MSSALYHRAMSREGVRGDMNRYHTRSAVRSAISPHSQALHPSVPSGSSAHSNIPPPLVSRSISSPHIPPPLPPRNLDSIDTGDVAKTRSAGPISRTVSSQGVETITKTVTTTTTTITRQVVTPLIQQKPARLVKSLSGTAQRPPLKRTVTLDSAQSQSRNAHAASCQGSMERSVNNTHIRSRPSHSPTPIKPKSAKPKKAGGKGKGNRSKQQQTFGKQGVGGMSFTRSRSRSSGPQQRNRSLSMGPRRVQKESTSFFGKVLSPFGRDRSPSASQRSGRSFERSRQQSRTKSEVPHARGRTLRRASDVPSSSVVSRTSLASRQRAHSVDTEGLSGGGGVTKGNVKAGLVQWMKKTLGVESRGAAEQPEVAVEREPQNSTRSNRLVARSGEAKYYQSIPKRTLPSHISSHVSSRGAFSQGNLVMFLQSAQISGQTEGLELYVICEADVSQDCSSVVPCTGDAVWNERLTVSLYSRPRVVTLLVFAKRGTVTLGRDELVGSAELRLALNVQNGSWKSERVQMTSPSGCPYRVALTLELAVLRTGVASTAPSEVDVEAVTTTADSQSCDMDEEAIAKRQRLHQHVVTEITSTESDYVIALQTLCQLFLQPLLSRAREGSETSRSPGTLQPGEVPALPETVIHDMFPSIAELSQLHSEEVLPLVQAAVSDGGQGRGLGPAFVKIAPLLKMYVNYLTSYEDGIHTFSSLLASNKAFVTYVGSQECDPVMKGLRLADMLIKPFQRLTKYLLLLRELHKYTEPGSEEQADVAKAMESVGKVTSEINEKVRQVQTQRKVMEVNAIVQSQIKDFVQPNRRFICEGTFTRIKGAKRKGQVQLYLFCDLQPKGMSASNGFSETGVLVAVYKTKQIQTRVLAWSLQALVFEYVSDTPELENAFRIYGLSTATEERAVSGGLLLEVSAPTPELRDEWLGAFLELRVPLEGFPAPRPLTLPQRTSVTLVSRNELAGNLAASLCLSRAPNLSKLDEQSATIRQCCLSRTLPTNTAVSIPLRGKQGLANLELSVKRRDCLGTSVDVVCICVPVSKYGELMMGDFARWVPKHRSRATVIVLGALPKLDHEPTLKANFPPTGLRERVAKTGCGTRQYMEANFGDGEAVRQIMLQIVAEQCGP